MAKRLLLVLGTLAVMVGGLVVYSRYAASDLPPGRAPLPGDLPATTADSATVGGVPVGPTGEVWLARTDEVTGLRTEVIRFREAYVEGDRHTLIEPDVEIYLPGGQTVRITADTAVVRADEVAGSLEPRESRLTGNVHIRVDLNTLRDDQRPGEDQRPWDFIHIRTGEMYLNNVLQEISAPGAVEVTGRDVLIKGKDLLLQWDTAPRAEPRRLRLAQGERIEVRRPAGASEPSDDDDGAAAAAPPATAPAGPQAEPPLVRAYRLTMAEAIEVHRGAQHMKGVDRLALLFAFEDDAQRRSASPSERSTARAAATAPAAASAPATASAPAGDAEAIAITWTGPLEIVPVTDRTDLKGLTLPPPGQFALAASGPALTLTDATAGEEMTAACGEARFASATDTFELGAGDRPDGQVDLTIARVGNITGRFVRVSDQDRTIDLDGPGTFTLDTAGDATSLGLAALRRDGAAGEPAAAQPDRPDGWIRWQRGVRLKYDNVVDDDGSTRNVPVSAAFLGDAVFTSPDGATMGGDALVATFAPAPRAEGEADSGRPMDSADLTAVNACGAAHLDSGDGRQAINARWIEIALRRTDGGRTLPRQLYALGDVAATLDEDDIAAHELLLDFSRPSQAGTAEGGSEEIEAVAMRAWGGVRLTRREGGESTTVRGETFDGDLAGGRYAVAGRPAEVDLDGQWLRGGQIVMTGERIGRMLKLRQVTVVTGGMARLMLEKDLSGEDLPAPQPAYVQWDDRMSFHRGSDEVQFNGNVRFDTAEALSEQAARQLPLDSPGGHLRCDTLTVWLEPEAPPTEEDRPADEATAASRPAEEAVAPSRPAGEEIAASRPAEEAVAASRPAQTEVAASRPDEDDDSLSMKRDLRRLLAQGNVRLLARREDEQGRLLGRMKVEADRLDRDAVADSVEVAGAGTLSFEDYRPPSDPTRPGGDLDRPSQTLFAWRERMALVRTGGTAVEDDAPVDAAWEVAMEGDVRMTHRSGRQVVGLDKLPIVLPSELPEGRATELDCRELTARLASREPSDGAAGDALSRDVELFQAIGAVVLREGPYEAQGGQIIYDDRQQAVMIYGAEDPVADPATPARVYFDPPGHRQGSWTSSPEFRIRRIGDRYEVTAIDAAGGGLR